MTDEQKALMYASAAEDRSKDQAERDRCTQLAIMHGVLALLGTVQARLRIP